MYTEFYKGKTVFITGHTGFKGAWMCETLKMLGANVVGYALKPKYAKSLFELGRIEADMISIIGDIRDLEKLKSAIQKTKPEIVIHMAAQPLVIESYNDPVYTYQTNVMGTINILEAIRESRSVKSFVNVTTDKVYCNKEWVWGYRENEELDGFDPYSNSKSCSELVTKTYKRCFFNENKLAISSVRAGNVIGGGDFSDNRIIPDCIKAVLKKEKILVRNPYSIRPYQHVLEPVMAYLHIASEQYIDKTYEGEYNIGPEESDCISTGELVDLFCHYWGEDAVWESGKKEGPHEASFLKLDCSKIKKTFGWKPNWNIEKAIDMTVEWTKNYRLNNDIKMCMHHQIKDYWNSSVKKG